MSDDPTEPPMFPDDFADAFSLFLDVDGTLIDIAHHPDAVRVAPLLLSDLEAVNRLMGGAVALISGRTILNLDVLFHPLRLRASGVHGAEFRFEPGGDIEPDGPMLPAETWDQLVDRLAAFPGTLAENKTFSFAVHYRMKPDARPDLEQMLGAFIGERPDLGLRLMPGHFVFELKPPTINKGAAIARFLDRPAFRGRRPIFLGDDVTDQAGFDMVLAHHGLAYSVGFPAPGVSGNFATPAVVREWLSSITRLEKQSA